MITFSIIIPAYNEEKFLSRTLISAKKVMAEIELLGEVIVVDNNSTDRTQEIARENDARIVFEKYNQISKARNAGASVAEGKYFIFLDADTILSADVLSVALENLSSGSSCGGGCKIEIDRKLTFLSKKFLTFWNWISVRKSYAAGCFVYCLREGFEDVGGFSEKVYASEEIWFSKKLSVWGKPRGLKFKIITKFPIVTSGRKLDNEFQFWGSMFVMLFFPFAIFFRKFCSHWYNKK